MVKLKKDGILVFNSGFEMSGDSISIDNNSNYTFEVCNTRFCIGDISLELYKNDKLCQKKDILQGKSGCLTFKTNYKDDYKIAIYPKYELPICPP